MSKFDNLNETFNIGFAKAEDDSSAFLASKSEQHNMITLPSESEQLLPDNERAVLENKRFVKSELESLIAQCQEVVVQQKEVIFEEDSRPSTIMAFADLVRTTRDLLSELNMMDKTENDLNIKMKMAKNKSSLLADLPSGSNVTFNSINLNGKEMVERILEFKRGSEMNDIANFTIEGSED